MNLVSAITGIFIRVVNAICNRQHFSVLTYHRVMPANQEEYPDALDTVVFEQQLIWLKKFFNVLSLQNALQLAKEKRLPRNVVVITIDDGYKDCFQYVLPLLQKYDLTATFFISTSGLKNGYLWECQISQCFKVLDPGVQKITLGQHNFEWQNASERRTTIQKITDLIKYQPLAQRKQLINELSTQLNCVVRGLDSFLTSAELKQMHNEGMTIGAHTVNHPILSLETAKTAFDEIARSKDELEKIIGAPVYFFAYPNGKFGQDFTADHIQMVQNLNFQAAFSTEWGTVDLSNDHPFLLKRFTPWDKDPSRFCLRLALSALSEHHGFRWLRKFVRQETTLYYPPAELDSRTNENA